MVRWPGALTDRMATLRASFVDRVYATHNSSPNVRATLASCLEVLGDGDKALNVGSGNRRLHPAVINLDITAGTGVDVVASAEALPFPDRHFALVITQETLEHVRDPFAAVREMYRVLQPGGSLYCQVPFTIGYHPGPTDYWRFSREGITELVEQAGFQCEDIRPSVGAAIGFYRIAVEFFSILVANISQSLYHPAKAGFALVLYPIKVLDRLLPVQQDRIAGGYIVIARRPHEKNTEHDHPDSLAAGPEMQQGDTRSMSSAFQHQEYMKA